MIDEYVVAEYAHVHNDQFYHWGTMAAAARAEQDSDPRLQVFLYALTENLIVSREDLLRSEGNSCHLVEGLATFVDFMQRRDLGDDRLVHESRK